MDTLRFFLQYSYKKKSHKRRVLITRLHRMFEFDHDESTIPPVARFIAQSWAEV